MTLPEPDGWWRADDHIASPFSLPDRAGGVGDLLEGWDRWYYEPNGIGGHPSWVADQGGLKDGFALVQTNGPSLDEITIAAVLEVDDNGTDVAFWPEINTNHFGLELFRGYSWGEGFEAYTNSGGGYIYEDDHRPSKFITILRQKTDELFVGINNDSWTDELSGVSAIALTGLTVRISTYGGSPPPIMWFSDLMYWGRALTDKEICCVREYSFQRYATDSHCPGCAEGVPDVPLRLLQRTSMQQPRGPRISGPNTYW